MSHKTYLELPLHVRYVVHRALAMSDFFGRFEVHAWALHRLSDHCSWNVTGTRTSALATHPLLL